MGVIFGLFFLISYRKGLKDGLSINSTNGSCNVNSEVITPLVKNPIQAVKKYKQNKEEEKKVDLTLEGIQNMLNYTGDPQGGGK